jgi:hypothetical protein
MYQETENGTVMELQKLSKHMEVIAKPDEKQAFQAFQ